jgi:hypothetical protein
VIKAQIERPCRQEGQGLDGTAMILQAAGIPPMWPFKV